MRATEALPAPGLPPAALHRHNDGTAWAVFLHELRVALAHIAWARKVAFGGCRVRHRRGAVGTRRRPGEGGPTLREPLLAPHPAALGRCRVNAAKPDQAERNRQ